VATLKSFDSVTITHNDIHDCAFIGIYTEGAWPASNHKNLYIAFNKVHHNHGNSGVTAYPSGSGIQVSGFDGGTLEHNETYENGGGVSGFTDGGGVGLWCVDALHILIQYNESHHNHAAVGSVKDGGGFDMDGGASKCVTQYNYSHDNEGPGFMVYDYGSEPMDSLVIRYNVSINDANKSPAYGGLFFGGTIVGNVKKIYVYNNTIVIDTTFENGVTYPVSGRSGIGFTTVVAVNAVDSLFFYNNIIYTNGVETIGGTSYPTHTVGDRNIYYSPHPAEMNLAGFGKKTNPYFITPNYAPSTIGVTSLDPPYRNPFATLVGYTPQAHSPANDSSFVLYDNSPKIDIIGTYIMQFRDIGAIESVAPISPLGESTIDFPSTSANAFNDENITVTGAVDGDVVALGVQTAALPSGAIYIAWVSAPNVVSVRLFNPTGGSVNPPAAIFKVRIIR
jgi:hypothetical protein